VSSVVGCDQSGCQVNDENAGGDVKELQGPHIGEKKQVRKAQDTRPSFKNIRTSERSCWWPSIESAMIG
jgi:hypothetical protein